MSIISSNYSKLNISANELYKKVESQSTIAPEEAISITADLLEHRKTLFQLMKEDLFTQQSQACYTLFVNTTEKLNKTQSKLIKKLTPNPVLTKSFCERVEKIWRHTMEQEIPFDNFGHWYSKANPKDTIVLEALHIQLRVEVLQDLKSAYQNRDKSYAPKLLEKLYPEDRLYIENCVTQSEAFKKSKLSSAKEFILTNMQGQWNPVIVEILDAYLKSEKIKNHVQTFPIVHQTLLPGEYLSLRHEYTQQPFTTKALVKINERSSLKYTDNETVRDLLHRNVRHPLILEAKAATITETQLIPLKKALSDKDWLTAALYARNLFEDAKQILEEKQLLINKKPASTFMNFLFYCIRNKAVPKLVFETIDYTIDHFVNLELENREISLSQSLDIKEPFVGIFTVYDPKDSQLPQFLPNLKRAFAAIEFALRKIPISSNFFNHEERILDPRLLSYNQTATINDRVHDWREMGYDFVDRYLQQKKLANDLFPSAIVHTKSSLIHPVGNCEEMSKLAFNFLLQTDDEGQLVELVSIDSILKKHKGDHAFVLFGRDPKGKREDPTTWGPKAVVCGPWERTAYPGKLIHELLYNYKEVDKKGFPVLEKYNPKTQYLFFDTENLPKDTFFVETLPTELRSLMEQLHAPSAKDQKKKIASQILQKIDQLPKDTQFLYPYSSIKMQMHYYLDGKLFPKKEQLTV